MPGNYSTERKGIAAVQAKLADLELIWRETSTGDFGIDGHIEFLDENSEPTGMMVGVQVKSGQSYFLGETDYTVSYTANEKHQKYWEHYPVPVLLILHHPDRKETFWTDARQEFRTGKALGNKIVIPKSNNFMTAQVDDLFKNAGLTQTEYVKDISALLEYMLTQSTRNAGFDLSFFDLFCLGMTNICRSLYFGMDLALKIAEHKLAAAESEFGVGLGHSEYDFLESYIRFLVSQNLVHANYSDLLIDLELREMVPEFIVPLSRRGTALKDLISRREDDLVEQGLLLESRSRVAQEAFIEIVEMSMFPRFGRVAEIARILRPNPVPQSSQGAIPIADSVEKVGAEN
ncbi:hypothetical protein SIAM614_21597 [Stappia aggregata IAM 12614]|uniref:DUF4365 domain-containing protein n=1 Tax=Roseibium aggregatum (strain ATCC 25650 / DSM 13394 / JCM 20685 / NBRC 16684 / NCIMB 2208 / IAM 12614 / B1) TaxID=384765 RepID=A0P354_ROSAI|nr:DUF4365 domain-containing protein [Roseibium aggregatum]EAV40525.1 hypothetical protein SIAM614_21597 [Stappia aggregata IAM 12614] [Roseibium aggregatum IAM 12614]